jgi:hypothetical protein
METSIKEVLTLFDFDDKLDALKFKLQEVLDIYDDYIEQLVQSRQYKDYRYNSVPLEELDAVILFCKKSDAKAYTYLKNKNKRFSFNITEGFTKSLIYMMKSSYPIRCLDLLPQKVLTIKSEVISKIKKEENVKKIKKDVKKDNNQNKMIQLDMFALIG